MKQKSGGLNIPFSESTDHTLVTLYTHLNKRVGPMTVENAEQTMMRWQKSGIELFVAPRTEEQVAEYKKTDKYKKLHAEWVQRRKQRHAASKKESAADIAKMVAVETGKAVASEMSKSNKGK